MTVAPSLTTIPPEIHLDILKHLSAHELVRLSRTCRTLRHLSNCKSVAEAFMRRRTAEKAIEYLQKAKIKRTDLVAELFRHVQDRIRTYPIVTMIAARLNDVKQLEAWHAEFGFIPRHALTGAARSDRIETVDYLLPRVATDGGLGHEFFDAIGTYRNRALLDQLRTKYPEKVTPEDLVCIVKGSVKDRRWFDFALEVFDSLPPQSGDVIIACALEIAKGAAACGHDDVFWKFIQMFQYDEMSRNEIAASAAINNQDDMLIFQEESRNRACSFQKALAVAVDNNAFEALEYLLDLEIDVWRRLSRADFVDAFVKAVKRERTAMWQFLAMCVPVGGLLRGAVASKSLFDAGMLMKAFKRRERQLVHGYYLPNYDFGEYSVDVPDWKMAVWLVVLGLDDCARSFKFNISGAERAHYRRVLPTSIKMARELDLSQDCIDQMTQFVNK